MRRLPTMTLGLGLALAMSAPAVAQPALDLSVASGFDSLRAGGADGDQRRTTAVTFAVEHLALDERLRTYYDLDAQTYSSEGDWASFLHHAGATYRFPLGDDQRHSLFAGGSAWVRANGTSWAAAGFTGLSAFTNLELRPRDSITLRSGYRFDARRFPDLRELDQLEQTAFLSVNASFASRTTLIAEVQAGVKAYKGATTAAYTISEAVPDDTRAADRARQMGRGGIDPLVREAVQLNVISQPSGSARQVTWLGRVAQSLADRTGVWAQYSGRRTGGQVAPIVISTPAWFFDDGVYDDPFASDALTVETGARHQLASGAALDLSASRTTKDYTATVALDPTGAALPGSPLRTDGIWRGLAAWTQPILPDRTGNLSVELATAYQFVHHRSNDAFYQYTSHAVTVGVSIRY